MSVEKGKENCHFKTIEMAFQNFSKHLVSGYVKRVPFAVNGYIKGKGLNLGVEPPSIKRCWISPLPLPGIGFTDLSLLTPPTRMSPCTAAIIASCALSSK